jgi:hypothetical protein
MSGWDVGPQVRRGVEVGSDWGAGGAGWGVDPTSVASPGFRQGVAGYWNKFGDWVSGAGQQARTAGGNAMGGANNAVNAGFDMAVAAPGKIWNSGKLGKAGLIGAGVLVGSRLAYPLLSGSGVIGNEQQEQIGNNPVGRFMTGEVAYDPRRDQRIHEDRANEYITKQQALAAQQNAEMRQDYIDRAKFDSEMAYQNAEAMGGLGLALGTNAKFRDVYAGQLASSTDNYLKNMHNANNAIAQILSPNIQVI